MRKKNVLGAGLIAVDHIFLSKKKHDKNSTFLGSSGGGTVSNILTMLSLLGYQCSVFGVIGNDENSYLVMQDLQHYGVTSKYLRRRGTSNKVVHTREYSHVIYENGKHEFLENCELCGTKFKKEFQISRRDLTRDILMVAEKTDILVVDRANEATLRLAKTIKSKSGSIAYDLNFVSYGKYQEKVKDMLKKSDLVKTNKQTLVDLMKLAQIPDISSWMRQYPNIQYLLISDEKNGVICYFTLNGEDHSINLPSIENQFIKDTAGAGDIFFSICINELLNENAPDSLQEFRIRVDRAQALASLSCSLYGSRSLQRYLLTNKFSTKEIMEYAETIRNYGRIQTPLQPSVGIMKYSPDVHIFPNTKVCKACGHSRDEQSNISLKSGNVNKALNMMNKALTGIPMAMLNGFHSALTYRDQINDQLQMNAIFVGSGGSFSAATFGEFLLLKGRGIMAKAVTPYELEGLNYLPPKTCVWLISHGGENTDILGAALRLETLNQKNVIVITGNRNSKLSELSEKNGWKVVLIPSQERNFVSTVGLLSQVSSLIALLSDKQDLPEFNEYFNLPTLNGHLKTYYAEAQMIVGPKAEFFKTRTNTHLIAFARGWGYPSLVDLESKIIEGGICTIEVTELKNYTHGRWVNLYGREGRVIIMYETPDDTEIIEFFTRKFRAFPFMRIQTQYVGEIGAIDLLLKTLLIVYAIGGYSKLNILKPKFPKAGKGLYSWEPSFRKGYWAKINAKIKDTVEYEINRIDENRDGDTFSSS